jgi:hypothetical protein
MLYDPIPDPLAAGWTKEGDAPHVPAGTVLEISDGTNSSLCRFFVEAASAFYGEIELNPSLQLAPPLSPDDTGAHVAINDGERVIRAAVFGTDTGTVRVALETLTGYTSGFVFPNTRPIFQVKRLADGSAVLAVAGQTPETVSRLHLALSRRPGVQTLEFGADSRSGVVTTEWFTLGLSPLPRETAFATFTVTRLQLRVRA